MTQAKADGGRTAHTPTPWHVGYTGRCIIKEVPGLSDSDDGYTVAVLTAHSLLPDLEAKANAAFIVRACNSHDALVKALDRLYRAYVNMLEGGRDRIVFLGGDCDTVEVMEAGDPVLVATRAALSSTRSDQQ